jgi:biopolymer transport protein TolR
VSKRRERDGLRNIATIDVTPLVDLTFLLLIVFMITAPVLERSVDVTPPSLSAQPIDDKPHRIINLTRAGEIRIGDQTLGEAALEAELLRLRSEQPDLLFFIRADESRPYGEVMGIMKIARRAGVENISLVTLPENP